MPKNKMDENVHEHILDNEVFSASVRDGTVFLAARKHSSQVRIFKFVLPVLAVVIALVFSWYTFFAAPSSAEIVTLNSEGSSDNKLVMTKPKVEGYTSANKPYALDAQRAIQDPQKSGIIELESIRAKMPLGNRGEALVDAAGGIYDNINGRLQLNKPFTVKTSDGVSAKLQSADVNIETSQLSTREPVEIRRGGEHLSAKSMRVLENGQVFLFEGGVRLVIDRSMEQSKQATGQE